MDLGMQVAFALSVRCGPHYSRMELDKILEVTVRIRILMVANDRNPVQLA